MPMSGNTSAVGNNIKSFPEAKGIEKGSDPMPRGTGHLDTQPMNMSMKEFSRTESTACGIKK